MKEPSPDKTTEPGALEELRIEPGELMGENEKVADVPKEVKAEEKEE